MLTQPNTTTEATYPKLTLKELGNHLPVETKNKKDQFFSFINWGTIEEKKISKIRDQNPNMGRFITQVLMSLLDKVNGDDFHGQDEKKKMLLLNQMPIANPLYMYFYLRYDQMGEELLLNIQCPRCAHRVENFVGNLGDLDVDCKHGNWEEILQYKLKKPITLSKGDQLVETLLFRIGPWDIMERMDEVLSIDQAEMKFYTLKNHLTGAVGVDGYLNPQEIIDKIHKLDLEMTQRLIAIHNAGPAVQQSIECPKCRFKFYNQVNWNYDSFFGASSLSMK
jgi:DNA-directed RNA polymerase subunit RPC12/RpoP